jgi:hypothetical protein
MRPSPQAPESSETSETLALVVLTPRNCADRHTHEFALLAPLTWLTPPFPQGSPRVPRTGKNHSRAPWHQNSTSRRKAALARLDLLAPDLVFRGYSAGVSAFLSCALRAPGLRRSLPWPVCSPSFAAIASRLLTRLRLGVAPVSVFFRGQGLRALSTVAIAGILGKTTILYSPALRRVNSIPDFHSEF